MKLIPLVSEKSMAHASDSVYTFIVDSNTTKPQIAKVIRDVFGVDVTNVRTLNRKGKTKRYKKTSGKRSDTCIALVRINPKQKIDGFEIEVPSDEKTKVAKESSNVDTKDAS